MRITHIWIRPRGYDNRMYQGKVDVDIPNAIKSVLADISSVSPSSLLYVLLLRRRRPKRVLTATSIVHVFSVHCTVCCICPFRGRTCLVSW